MFHLIIILALVVYTFSTAVWATKEDVVSQFRESIYDRAVDNNSSRLSKLEECRIDEGISLLSRTVGYRLPGQQTCKFSPLEAARTDFCSTNERMCIPYQQMERLAKTMHFTYVGNSVVDRSDGVLVVFEGNAISVSIFSSMAYEYARAPHNHPEGWVETRFPSQDHPENRITEHSVEIVPLESVPAGCNDTKDSAKNCVEKIICVDNDIDLSIESCTKSDLSRDVRMRLDQIYKDAVAALYVSKASKNSAANPCGGRNPCNPFAATNPCNPCAGRNPYNPCAGRNPCNPCGGKNPCAGKNPCNPCIGKNPCNPCAGKNPCNPCAGKKSSQPCAGKNPCNPCSGKNPCNPCAGKNPCNPCVGKNPCNPCAGKNPCNPCAGKNPSKSRVAKNPCNPCAGKNSSKSRVAKNPCNPCAGKNSSKSRVAKNPCNPCSGKKPSKSRVGENPCNPCAGKIRSKLRAGKNPCNPCAAKILSKSRIAKNPCNPCATKNPTKPRVVKNPVNPCVGKIPWFGSYGNTGK